MSTKISWFTRETWREKCCSDTGAIPAPSHPCSLPASPRLLPLVSWEYLACLPLLHSYHLHTWVSQPLIHGEWTKSHFKPCSLIEEGRQPTPIIWHNVSKSREKGKANQVPCIGTVCRHADCHSFEPSLSLPEMILRKYLKCISWRFQIRHQRKSLAASLHLITENCVHLGCAEAGTAASGKGQTWPGLFSNMLQKSCPL